MPTETNKWRRGSALAHVTSVYGPKPLSERIILNQDHTVTGNWLPCDSSWIQGVRQEVISVQKMPRPGRFGEEELLGTRAASKMPSNSGERAPPKKPLGWLQRDNLWNDLSPPPYYLNPTSSLREFSIDLAFTFWFVLYPSKVSIPTAGFCPSLLFWTAR